MSIRLILPILGAITGWFLFEDMIIGASVFIIIGVSAWIRHKKKINKKLGKKSFVVW